MHSYLFKRALIGALGLVSSLAIAAPQVTLSDGVHVTGQSEHAVESFLGIPYAKAPVGGRRWQVAQLDKLPAGTFNATHEGAICPQYHNDQYIGQENCLNLDIYRPATHSHALPVLVYVHGGNNQGGKAHEFDPTELAKALNAVVVQINYRLGVLGFNPLKAIKTSNPAQASGNFGLLDQRTALKWVHQHIKAFGGDPSQVTVAGFSAGGRDVMAMLISPLFKGAFQRAIVFSGGMTTAPVAASQKIFINALAPLVVKDKMKPDLAAAKTWLAQGDQAVRKYLMKLPASRLAALMTNAGIRMSAFPHLYRDGYVLPKKGFKTTHYNAVPVIMLSGQTEFSFFALGDPHFAKAWHDGTLLKTPSLLQQYRFVYHYGGQLYSLFNVQRSAERMYPHYPAPIYGTEVALGRNNYVTPGATMSLLGAFHGVFMPLLDHHWNQKLLGKAFQRAGALDLSAHFRQYLAAFIRHGNPNRAAQQPKWLRWSPQHQQQGQSLMILNANQYKAVMTMSAKTYNEKELIAAMKQDHSLPQATKMELIHTVLNGRWFSDELDRAFHSPSLWPAAKQ
ncbi:carboxylesterase family protein [Celerinatantimonas diazotrophica]|uniref:Carboxylic ester hydrolase n=1 Tax=Celerinatantimonas diazotrophica TaxID=412034 RepID=A0A4V2PNB1_9GAMM|nr:carboxylesterase family protein [Celerinatantimonas diazotrophica]TCK46348.1 para-nitrobenzyl esterase [Celerinatantimonas diazotrophica]CAG9295278.1 hypothetical protein CEDIAZO_00390 [Celerinatantimonas diazotrophica]